MHNIVKEIFRNYDIRGVYNETLFDEDAFLIGKAFGSVLVKRGAKNCAVGYDNRLSSSALFAKYCGGLLSTGIDVIDLGECLTPLVKFYVYETKRDAGTSLTASHNPAEYNGFKLMLENARPFYGNDILDLYDDEIKGDFVTGTGKLIKADDLLELYTRFLSARFDFKGKEFKVALNCGNGTASNFAPKILCDLGVEVVEVNCVSNGSFPNGAPDPERPDFMQVLKEKVVQEKCHLGFGLDGDSDRFGLVDENGTHYESDTLMMLLAQFLLPTHPRGLICCDVKSSLALVKKVHELGGECKIIKTGYPYHIPQAQGDALFSAEFSGHFFLGTKLGFYGLDDAIAAACTMLKVLSEGGGKKFSQLMEKFPKLYHTSEVKIDCADDVKMEVMAAIVKKAQLSKQIKDILTIDGFRANVSDVGWFLIRASNTGHYITARVEGQDQGEVARIKSLVTDLLMSAGIQTNVVKDASVYFS